ncbi:type II secretory system protein [Candidatus Scalindua japonica]|uniref:Type II secretory system protein n=1 Tax=Candidatus Scalindua japonica TaxID=1284222 RepID=A0A286TY96_9BACT|nr:prepilin-type N-terminal cleavage/methylation domain-containing protein [Candidatus Scalindua japonica]GAX60869.1 type II secretory system protein [Candidatus Scalindua japonica]
MSTSNIQSRILSRKLEIVNLKSKNGFTLVELFVVIVIMMFLAGITIPIISSIQTNAKKGVTSAQISQLELALKQFESDFGFFPPDSYKTTDTQLSLGSVNIPCDDDLDTGSKCLIFFLGSKFMFTKSSFTATYGPYIEFKKSQLEKDSGASFTGIDTDITIAGVNGTTDIYRYKDPFGIYYSYDSSAPTHNTVSFDLYSNGPDQETASSGDDVDDINNW